MPVETPSEDHRKAAESLRNYAKNKNVQLWLRPLVMEGGVAYHPNMEYDPGEDKGLSFLAKRLYMSRGYSSKDALDAAILLSAKFVEKIGTPELHKGDRLSVNDLYASLTYTDQKGLTQKVLVELIDPAAKAEHQADVQAVLKTAVDQRSGIVERDPTLKVFQNKMLLQQLKASGLTDGTINIQDVTTPRYGLEAYQFRYKGHFYFVCVQLLQWDANHIRSIRKIPKYRVTQSDEGRLMTGTDLLPKDKDGAHWTTNFSDVIDAIERHAG